MADDWTEKYRPQSLNDIVGNPSAAATMRQWAEQWNRGAPSKRALVLMGTPGIGKTSSAEALARDMGWGIVEMNASDQRTGEAIRNVALRASYFNTFDDDGNFMSVKDGGMKLVVLDEADSLFGNADRGAMPVINELIKCARQPVILIVNDFYELSRKSSAVKTETVQISFRKPTASAVQNVLAKICRAEGVDIDPLAISKIAENANGDLRAAIRDLESLAYGYGSVTSEDASVLTGRVVRKDMYALMDAVFRKKDPQLAFHTYNEVDEDPGTVALWMEENIPYECHSTGDLVRCCERLSRADVYLGRIMKRQNYGFMSYARDMMTSGIPEALHSKKVTCDRFRFPQYLMKMSRSKSSRSLRRSLCQKLGYLTHNSGSRIQNDCYDFYRTMAMSDPEFRVMLVRDAGLEPEELGFLIDQKMDSKQVKQAFEEAFPKEEKEPKKTSPRKKASKKEQGLDFAVPEKKEEPAAKTQTSVGKTVPDPEVRGPSEKAVTDDKGSVNADDASAKTTPAPPKKTQKSLFDF